MIGYTEIVDTDSHEVVQIDETVLKVEKEKQTSLDNWWIIMCDFDCRFRDRNYCGLFDDVLDYEECIFQDDECEDEWSCCLMSFS